MFNSRDLVLVSSFSAILLAYGAFSGVYLTPVIHSIDLFFLIATLFTILALEIRQSWSATLLGTITGLIFFGTPGAPAPYHITAALVGNGLTFDLVLRLMIKRTMPPSRVQIVSAAAIGNFVMAIVGLSALQLTVTITALQWAVLVPVTVLLGVAGALFGLALERRIRFTTRIPTRTLNVEITTPQVRKFAEEEYNLLDGNNRS